MTLARLVATLAGIGYLRPASGTWGSAAAVVLAWVVGTVGGVWLLLALTLAAVAAGLWATRIMTAAGGDEDPSEIVVDELVGQWIALLPVVYGAAMMGLPLLRLWPGWVSAFLLFRLFDIWKPWLAGRADARGDAMGVMLDDVWAGIFAAVVTVFLAAIAHGFLM